VGAGTHRTSFHQVRLGKYWYLDRLGLWDFIQIWCIELAVNAVANCVDCFSRLAVISQVGTIRGIVPELNAAIHVDIRAVIRASFGPDFHRGIAV